MTLTSEEFSESIGKMFFIEGNFLVAHKSDHIRNGYFVNKFGHIFTKTPEDILFLWVNSLI